MWLITAYTYTGDIGMVIVSDDLLETVMHRLSSSARISIVMAEHLDAPVSIALHQGEARAH